MCLLFVSILGFFMITFEKMPEALTDITERLARMENMLSVVTIPPKPQSDLLTIQEAAELLSLSVQTLYSKISRRELPFSKAGKRVYFSKTELLAFVKEGRRLTTDEIKLQAIQNAATAMKGGAA